MTPDTSSVAEFSWFSRGSTEYREAIGITDAGSEDIYNDIIRGRNKIDKSNSVISKIKAADPSTSKHLYLNFREYSQTKCY